MRKPQASVEPFSRDKLLLSVYDSLRHRKTALEDAVGLYRTIVSKLLPQIEKAAVESTVIQEVTFSVLKRFDKAAATHYRAYHPVTK